MNPQEHGAIQESPDLPRREAGASRAAGASSRPRDEQTEETRVGITATLKLLYAGAPNAAAAARRVLASLEDYVEPDRLDDVLLLATELVTNAIRHAGEAAPPSVGLEVSVSHDLLRVEVTDPGPGFEPGDPEPDLDRAGGWGLFIVDQLADRWGVLREGGTRVWFEVDRKPD